MDNQDEAFSDYNPKKDRDPLDRAEELMEKYSEKVLNAAEAIRAPYSYPKSFSVTKIENGFLVASPDGQRVTYCADLLAVQSILVSWFFG